MDLDGPPIAGSRSRRRGWLAAALLTVAIVAVYGQVVRHQFVIWDDPQHVVANPLLDPVSASNVGEFWRRPYAGLYIPLSYTFFAAEASIARRPAPDGVGTRPNPAVFHLGNLVLHWACVLLAFGILRSLVHHDAAACAGALLFALHPVQVESVAWVSETRGLLCGLFSLTAVWLYLSSSAVAGVRRSTSVVCYVAAGTSFVLALLCKPAAVAVPLLAGAIEWGLLRRAFGRVLLRMSPAVALAAAWVVLTKLQQPDATLPMVPPIWARLLLAGDALAFSTAKLFLPLQCGPDYGRSPEWVMGHWWFYATWVLPVGIVALLASLRNRRLWLTAAAVFVAWLLPVSGLVPFDFQRISTVADRYLYLALLGPALALAGCLSRCEGRRAWAPVAAVLALIAGLSFVQTGYWRDDEALLTRALDVNPRSVTARQNRAFLLAARGEHEAAIALYREALADHPDHPELHRTLAISLDAAGRTDEAGDVLAAALKRNPRWPLVRCMVAELASRRGDVDRAAEEYRTVLEHAPDCAPAHLALGRLLLKQDAHDEAAVHFRAVLDDVHNRVAAHENLAVVAFSQGQLDEAKYHSRAALAIRPNAVVAHFYLANVLFVRGSLDEAAEHHRAALAVDPTHVRARVALGIILSRQGNLTEAAHEFREARRLIADGSEVAEQIDALLEQCLQR